MNIKVNGNDYEINQGATLGELVEKLKFNPQLIAAEVNEQLVTRSLHSQTVLNENDRVEIVTLVGGG